MSTTGYLAATEATGNLTQTDSVQQDVNRWRFILKNLTPFSLPKLALHFKSTLPGLADIIFWQTPAAQRVAAYPRQSRTRPQARVWLAR